MPAPQTLLNIGCVPRLCPPIRSSSFLAVSDPFGYLLRDRYGIYPAMRQSEALGRGTWMHTALRTLWTKDGYNCLVEDRVEEIKAVGKKVGMQSEIVESYIEEERQDARCAIAWMEAATQLVNPLSDSEAMRSGFLQHYTSDRYVLLGFEVRVVLVYNNSNSRCLKSKETKDLVTFDVLLYDKQKNGVLALDLKSCSKTPDKRLAICPIEFQTRHYINIGLDCIALGLFHKKWPDIVPNNATFLGLKHIAIQKPTIEFGSLDRTYTITRRALQRGKRKGEIVEEKVYSGSPCHDLYVARCKRWYLGQEEFSARGMKMLGRQCPVNISTTPPSYYTNADWRKWDKLYSIVERYSKMDPDPANFPSTATEFVMAKGESPYLDFYLTPPEHWPEVVRRKKLVFAHRDLDLDNVRESCILLPGEVPLTKELTDAI